jgi:2,4-dienoyl-CoA reductase-like NADH-dependent reductase (Old Yellow Enzyme family)
VKKISGRPTITVGSVSLSNDIMSSFSGEKSELAGIEKLLDRLERDEFDLVAIGRMLIADPDWPIKVREGRLSELKSFSQEALAKLE